MRGGGSLKAVIIWVEGNEHVIILCAWQSHHGTELFPGVESALGAGRVSCYTTTAIAAPDSGVSEKNFFMAPRMQWVDARRIAMDSLTNKAHHSRIGHVPLCGQTVQRGVSGNVGLRDGSLRPLSTQMGWSRLCDPRTLPCACSSSLPLQINGERLRISGTRRARSMSEDGAAIRTRPIKC